MSLSINSTTNTTFADSGEMTPHVVAPASTSVVMNNAKALEAATTDEQWMVKQMLAKPVQMDLIAWSTSDSQGSLLRNYNIPYEMLFANRFSPGYNVLKSYTFFRGNFHFKFMVNATKMHVGRLMVAWVPISVELVELNQFTLSGYPHVFVDAANSDASELIVPYFMPTNSFNLLTPFFESFRNAGVLVTIVLNPLLATANVSATVDVSIYSWFDDAEVRIPIDAGSTVLPTVNETQMGFLDSIGGAFGVKSSGKLMDSVSSLSNGVQSLFSGNFETAVGDFGSTLKNTAEFAKDNPELVAMCFDRPMCLKTEISSKKMTFSSLAYGKGSDTVSRLGLMPNAMHIPDEAVMAGHVAESNLLELCKKPMLYAQFEWRDVDQAGAQLFGWLISPTEFYHSYAVLPSLGQPTYLSAISDVFAFWRGSIKIRLDLVASQFHAGRLAVCYIPEWLNAYPNPTLKQAMSSPTVIIDLDNTENRSYEIEFPYISNRPWLRTDSTFDSEPRKRSVGKFFVFILNALVRPDNVVGTVGVNIYAYAGDDFALAFPAPPTSFDDNFDPANTFVPGYTPTLRKAVLNETQSGDPIADIDETPVDSTALVVTNNVLSPDYKHFFNEFSGDMRDVIRRYGMPYAPFVITSIPGANQKSFQLSIPVTPCGNGNHTYSLLGYYSRLFAGWSGSLRYKVLFSNSQINCFRMTACHNVETFATTPVWNATVSEEFAPTSGFYAIKVTNLTDEHGFELEVPYANPMHFCCLRGLGGGIDGYARTNGTLVLSFELPFTSSFADNVEVAIYVAAGDDFNFHFPIPMWQRAVVPS